MGDLLLISKFWERPGSLLFWLLSGCKFLVWLLLFSRLLGMPPLGTLLKLVMLLYWPPELAPPNDIDLFTPTPPLRYAFLSLEIAAPSLPSCLRGLNDLWVLLFTPWSCSLFGGWAPIWAWDFGLLKFWPVIGPPVKLVDCLEVMLPLSLFWL